jgi:DNA-binding CsgD family transcriptional regulator
MLDRIAHNFVDRMEALSHLRKGGVNFSSMCTLFDLKNISYLGANMPKGAAERFIVQSTYSLDWKHRYEDQNYLILDPIVHRGLVSTAVIDWVDQPDLNKKQIEFFAEAAEFGVGNQGLAIPIRGRFGESAIFSVAADMSCKDWADYKHEKLASLKLLADLYHHSLLLNVKPVANVSYVLSPRETECLKWSSEGKSQQDIADILSITPRTVRFFLEGARSKLNCLNTTHTVAEALLRGLI